MRTRIPYATSWGCRQLWTSWKHSSQLHYQVCSTGKSHWWPCMTMLTRAWPPWTFHFLSLQMHEFFNTPKLVKVFFYIYKNLVILHGVLMNKDPQVDFNEKLDEYAEMQVHWRKFQSPTKGRTATAAARSFRCYILAHITSRPSFTFHEFTGSCLIRSGTQ